MRAVLLDVPESLLAERRRHGADRWDEMWEGVLHMLPLPSSAHQGFGAELILALGPSAKAKGLEVYYETAAYKRDDDYRVPDLAFVRPSQRTTRGIEGGGELFVEILSPNDESYDKLAFYATFGVEEVLIVNPDTRALELFVLRGGKYHAVVADESGRVRSNALSVTFATREGPRFEVHGSQGSISSI